MSAGRREHDAGESAYVFLRRRLVRADRAKDGGDPVRGRGGGDLFTRSQDINEHTLELILVRFGVSLIF
jgi:hypothetical protein